MEAMLQRPGSKPINAMFDDTIDWKTGGAKKAKKAKKAKTASKPKKATKPRKPSAYNDFVGKHLRAGKTMAEAAKLWNASKS